jgi:MFS family permease
MFITNQGEIGMLSNLSSTNTAPSVGPILGGALAACKGWRWIFWFLTIASGVCLIFVTLFLPETARNVVSNGSVPATGVHKTVFSPLTAPPSQERPTDQPTVARRWYLPKPLNCIYLLFHRNASAIIFPFGLFYMTYSCIQASLSSLFLQLYRFNELQSGLVYLPFGVGCVFSAILVGKDSFRLLKAMALSLTRVE